MSLVDPPINYGFLGEARTAFDRVNPDPMPPALLLAAKPDAKFCLPAALAFAKVLHMDLANEQTTPTEPSVKAIGSAFTDTLLNVSLRGLDDTQVLGAKLVAELLKHGLQIVPTGQEPK